MHFALVDWWRVWWIESDALWISAYVWCEWWCMSRVRALEPLRTLRKCGGTSSDLILSLGTTTKLGMRASVFAEASMLLPPSIPFPLRP